VSGPLDAADLADLVAALEHAGSTRTGPALDAALEEIGWSDALAVAPRTAIGPLFEAQGAACHTSGALGVLLCSRLGVGEPAAPVLPAFGTAALPAVRTRDGVRVEGLLLGSVGTSGVVVVTEGEHGAARWATVPADRLAPRAVAGLDPDLGLQALDASVPLEEGYWAATTGSWDDAVALARLALGHELVGTMATMLELARTHALERVQFGRPIARFQAVRHRLAEALVAIEAARAALDGAWCHPSPTHAAIAKAACGHSAGVVRRHCQQVLAGIGFTDEHDLHRYVRRSLVLDGLFGGARSISAQLGAEVLARGRLPRPLPL